MNRKCSKCSLEKPIELFAKQKRRPDGYDSYCKECKAFISREFRRTHRDYMREKDREYKRLHKERIDKNQRRWVSDNKEVVAFRNFKSKLIRQFGITVQDYEKMFKEQNGACKICNGVNLNGIRLHVDHDHSSGRIRGLLCGTCNRALGLFKDSIEVMQKAIDYVEGVPSLVR